MAPFHAGNVGLHQAAAVAGALTEGDHFHGREPVQIIQPELDLAIRTIPANGRLPGSGVDLWNIGEVVAREKGVVGSDVGAEIFNWRFVVWRPIGPFDERLLARQCVQDRFHARALGQHGRKVELELGPRFGCKQPRGCGTGD
jgi:hypothetical protein